MSSEVRHIFFDDGELVGIIAVHLQRKTGRIPMGSILGLKLMQEAGVTLSGRVVPDRGDDDVFVSLAGRELKTAVISYCISQGIVLPLKGRKRVELFNNKLALIVTLNIGGAGLNETK